MLNFSKAAFCTAAAGAMAITSAAPAEAQRYRDRDRDGVSAGEVIAGALILGGIAAIASSSNRDRNTYRYRDNHYRQHQTPRRAINQCVRVAERTAQRNGYRFANVVDINRVRDTRRGWNITGRIEVGGQRSYRDQRRGNRGYNRGNDTGRFSCEIRRGRVTDIDYRGIRGLNRI